MSTVHLFVTSFPLFYKIKNSSPRGNCSFVYEVCCEGRAVYGPTSFFHLQKRSLTAENVGSSQRFKKHCLPVVLSFPRAKILIAVSCSGFNVARRSFSLPYIIAGSIAAFVGVSMRTSKRTSKTAKKYLR